MIGALNTAIVEAGPHVYSFTMHQLWTMVLSICGGITAVSAAIAVIIKVISKMKEPDNKQNSRLEEHDKKLDSVDKKLAADKDRLDLFQSKIVQLEERQKESSITIEVHERKIVEAEQRINKSEHGSNVTMKALLALLSHGIDGNAIEPMKEAKAALEDYLIDGQNNTKNIMN